MNGSSAPSADKWKERMYSSPTSKARTGLTKLILGIPGTAPRISSSMLGCVAAVSDTVSPSQPKPAVIQRTETDSNFVFAGSKVVLMQCRYEVDGRRYPISALGLMRPTALNVA